MAASPEQETGTGQAPDAQTPTSQPKATKSKFSGLTFGYFHLLVYAGPTWFDTFLLFTGTISAIASGVPFPIMGIVFGQLLDDLNEAACEVAATGEDASDVQSSVNEKVVLLVYIGIATFCLIYTYVLSWSIFSRRLEARLRDTYFRSLLRQDASFFDTHQAGELSSRLNADIQAIQTGTSEKVGICIGCISFFFTAYIVSFTQNAKLAAMLIALIPAFGLMATFGSKYTQKFGGAVSDGVAAASSVAQEALSHIAVVQAFGAGPRLEAKFATKAMAAQKAGIQKAIVAAVQGGTLYFIAYSANALAYWQGSRQIADTLSDDNGGVSVGQTYTVIFLLVDACIILGSIAPLLPLLGGAAGSFQKLRDDIERPSKIDASTELGSTLPETTKGSLSFHNVSFTYASRLDHPILKDVSFECPAGKHTALVGLSGSGKSTIAGLAMRLYDPSAGTVTIDGQKIDQLNVRSLRGTMALVQQEPSLLDRSILENIALGLVSSPQQHHQQLIKLIFGSGLGEIAARVRNGEELGAVCHGYGDDMAELIRLVWHAASLADVSGFIDRLEHGYGTLVGTGGKLVSGGQRQRIALARALIRDPKVLILDEATASLDSASEQRIQRAIESVKNERTLIAIAHRLSTIKNADNIIVLNQGQIIEQGTHLELMAMNGSYAGMVRLQNIGGEQHDDAISLTSTTRGDVDSLDKDFALTKEKAVDSADENIKDGEKSPALDTAEEAPAPDQAKAELDSNKSGGAVVSRLLTMARPHSHILLSAIFSGIIVGCMYCASALIFGHTIAGFSPCNSHGDILWAGSLFGGMFFMLASVELVANSVSWSGFGYVAEKLLYRFRVLSFRALYEQGLDWHQAAGRTSSSLLSVITTDAAAVGGFSGSILGTLLAIVVNFLVAIVLSHIIAWKIAIVCLVIVPVLLGSGIMQLRALAKFERKHAGAFSNAVGISVEAVNSFKTISSFSLEDEVLATYRRALAAPRKEVALASAYTNIWLALSNSTSHFINSFAYWWGSKQITEGNYTQTQFFIVLIAMLVSAQLWGHMFSLAPEVTRARQAASRILSLIDMTHSQVLDTDASAVKKEDIEASAGVKPKPDGRSGGSTVTFRNVSFAYPARPDNEILKTTSFTVQAGQFCGLVGPSGAGKSTILSLVQRMYSPTSGTIEIDGRDVCANQGTEFRDSIAVVPQDCALFDGTINFNVGLGAVPGHEASVSEIEEACKLANIHDTIMSLPAGYETECGPNGSRLSGGQRQRLAIARALVRRPRLLLLDESTSALDAESERALQEGLERAARGITVIAITHRLHTVRKANVIFVVEGGRVVDQGRHEELVERSESYRVNALQQMLDG